MIKRLLQNKLLITASIYTGTSIINKAIPFLLLPILTRLLTPNEYGIVSMFGILVSFVTPFIGVNVSGAITRMYYNKEDVDIKAYVANCLLILIITTFIVSVVFYLGADIIVSLTSIPYKVLSLVIIISFAQVLSQIALILWQVQMKPLQYGIFQVTQTSVDMFLSLTFVLVFGMSWYGRIIGQTLAYVLFIPVVGYIFIKNKWLRLKLDKKYIKHALGYGIPMVPHTLSAVIITLSDRLFITNMVGIETTGIYTVGYQIGMIISLLATSFNKAYVPWLFAKLKEGKIAVKRKIVKLTYAYFIIIGLTALSLSYITPLLLSVFVGSEYYQASIFVVWIALGYAFQGMFFMVVNYILYAQKTVTLAKVSFLAAIINIVLNYILIKKVGAIGAAQATTITYLLKFLLIWLLAAKKYEMPWAIWRK